MILFSNIFEVIVLVSLIMFVYKNYIDNNYYFRI